jgi:GNAT superfamily N-acetyltransferase
MIRVREAIAEDAAAIASLLTELGYPASASEIPTRLSAVAEAPGHVLVADEAGVGHALIEMAERQAAAWGCETLELTSRDDRQRTHRFYTGLGFESRSRKFVRPVAG